MKKVLILPLLLLLCCCAAKKSALLSGPYTILSPCPPQGTCSLEVTEGKGLLIKTDGAGKIYYSLEGNPEKTVVKYTYTKKSNPGYQDDFYIEEVIFETDRQLSNLQDGNPANTKLLFGVRCFCRGKAGYYRPKNGLVSYENNRLTVKLPEDIVEGQLINHIIIDFK